MRKLNAKWVSVAIVILVILYNTIVTHVILRNDVQHLQQDVTEFKQDLRDLTNFLLRD